MLKPAREAVTSVNGMAKPTTIKELMRYRPIGNISKIWLKFSQWASAGHHSTVFGGGAPTARKEFTTAQNNGRKNRTVTIKAKE